MNTSQARTASADPTATATRAKKSAVAVAKATHKSTQDFLDGLAPLDIQDPKLAMRLSAARQAHRALEACRLTNVLWDESETNQHLTVIPKRKPEELVDLCVERWMVARAPIRKLPKNLQQQVLTDFSKENDWPLVIKRYLRPVHKLFRECVELKAPQVDGLKHDLLLILTVSQGSYPALFGCFDHATHVLEEHVQELERLARGEKPRAPAVPKLDPNFDLRLLTQSEFELLKILAKFPNGLTGKVLVDQLKLNSVHDICRLVTKLEEKHGIVIENHRNLRGYVIVDDNFRVRMLHAGTWDQLVNAQPLINAV